MPDSFLVRAALLSAALACLAAPSAASAAPEPDGPVAPAPSAGPPAAEEAAAPTPPAQAPATAPPSQAGPAPTAAAAPGWLALRFGLKVGRIFPSGRPMNVVWGANAGNEPVPSVIGDRMPGGTTQFLAELGWTLPVPGRALAVTAEAGHSKIAGSGTPTLPQDPDFAQAGWAFTLRCVPLLLGVSYLPPLPLPSPRLRLYARGGFALVWSWVASEIHTPTQAVEGVPQTGWAKGFFAGLEGAYRLGPGDVTLEVRYLNARTDMRLPERYPGQPWNAEPGDVGGTTVSAGYRLEL